MGLLDLYLTLPDEVRKGLLTAFGNVKTNLQNPGEFLKSAGRSLVEEDKAAREKMAGWGSVMPEVRQQAYDAAMPMAMTALAISPVYHGSPHTFDKFDLSKIGTGEGAQAYGHGLYVAERPATAEVYKNALSDYAIEVGGKTIQPNRGSIADRAMAWVQDAKAAQAENPFQFAKKQARSILGKNSSVADDIIKQIEEWQLSDAKIGAGGNLYEGALRWSDASREATDPLGPRHFLDWDKQVKDQPDVVKKAIERLPLSVRTAIDPSGPREINDLNGGEIYRKLVAARAGEYPGATKGYMPPEGFNASAVASNELKNLGVQGIRYLDQGSRATSGGEIVDVFKDSAGKWRAKVKVTNRSGIGFMAPTDAFTTSTAYDTADAARKWAQEKITGGTSNYVVFDDALLEVLKRNGVPVKGLLGQ